MSIIAKIVENKDEIWVIDYLYCGEDEMMAAASELRKRIVAEGKPVLILVLVNDNNTLSSKYIKHMEKEFEVGSPLIRKIAIVGLNRIRQWKLKGYNSFYKRNLRAFEGKAEAMKYLLSAFT